MSGWRSRPEAARTVPRRRASSPRPLRAAPTACSPTRTPRAGCAGRSSAASTRRPSGCARPSDGDALAEAIHGARKDLKKARAALRLIREELGEKTFKRENRALRDAGRLLSASRDAEVKLATLDGLVEGDRRRAPRRRRRSGATALVADRDRIVGDGGSPTAEAVAAIEAVAARAPDWKIRRDGWKLLAPGLDTAYSEGRDAFVALGDSPSFEAVHELRKRGKDLWYQLRLLRDAWPPVLERDRGGDPRLHRPARRPPRPRRAGRGPAAGATAVDPAHRETLRALIEARQATLLAEARSRRRARLRGEAEGVRAPRCVPTGAPGGAPPEPVR